VRNEFALTLEDVVWRRSKLGLHLREETQNNIRRLVKALRQRPVHAAGGWGGDEEESAAS
jgi:glycerol-3-phosphate dehydrogenase